MPSPMQRQQRETQLPHWRCGSPRPAARCHRTAVVPHRATHHLPALLIAMLLLLQHIELHMCRQLAPRASDKQLHLMDASEAAAAAAESAAEQLTVPVSPRYRGSAAAETATDLFGVDKRSHSQPEEIFQAPVGNNMDMSYDEYPMIVPKRAALLLDRLMVALHRALEHDRSAQRIRQKAYSKAKTEYSNNNNNSKDNRNSVESTQVQDGNNFQMYSDDDPGVVMDYDFKDINQIHHATGQNLMAKSFQRRGGGSSSGDGGGLDIYEGDLSDDVSESSDDDATDGLALLANAVHQEATAGPSAGGGGGGGGSRRLSSGGRKYWRCYFNAVSCF